MREHGKLCSAAVAEPQSFFLSFRLLCPRQGDGRGEDDPSFQAPVSWILCTANRSNRSYGGGCDGQWVLMKNSEDMWAHLRQQTHILMLYICLYSPWAADCQYVAPLFPTEAFLQTETSTTKYMQFFHQHVCVLCLIPAIPLTFDSFFLLLLQFNPEQQN